jgi:hypothetical protein
MSHSRGLQKTSSAEDLLADGEARLLLENDERREPRIDGVNLLPITGAPSRHHRLHHFREGKASIEAVGARLKVERCI